MFCLCVTMVPKIPRDLLGEWGMMQEIVKLRVQNSDLHPNDRMTHTHKTRRLLSLSVHLCLPSGQKEKGWKTHIYIVKRSGPSRINKI